MSKKRSRHQPPPDDLPTTGGSYQRPAPKKPAKRVVETPAPADAAATPSPAPTED